MQYASFAEHGYGRGAVANPGSRCLSGCIASLAFISPVMLGYPLFWLIARKATRIAALACLLLHAFISAEVLRGLTEQCEPQCANQEELFLCLRKQILLASVMHHDPELFS
jgi:hypothetical protein